MENADTHYWKMQTEKARQQAAENLRIAAARATEIERLKGLLGTAEINIQNLRSALVAAGHTKYNCPVVAGASIDCWCPEVGTLGVSVETKEG